MTLGEQLSRVHQLEPALDGKLVLRLGCATGGQQHGHEEYTIVLAKVISNVGS